MSPEKKIEAGPAAENIAINLRRIRGRMSYAELERELKAVGRPIAVLGLRRIEDQKRRVDVDDLLALARALRVSPVSLMLPPDLGEPSEVLPGRTIPAWSVVKWLAGDGQLPMTEAEAERYGRGKKDRRTGLYEWYEIPADPAGDGPAPLYRRHEQLVNDWHNATSVARRLAVADEIKPQIASQLKVWAEEALIVLRAEMRRAGQTLPPLRDELAEIDKQARGRAK